MARPPRPADGDLIEVGGARVRLAVNPRARRVSLRIDAARREAVATAPSARKLAEAVAFAHSRATWIAERLAALPAPAPFRPGAVIETLGAPLRLERAALRIHPRRVPAAADEPARLIVSGEGEVFGRAVERALRAWALELLAERTTAHCTTLGLAAPPVAVMAARGRWGSCRAATVAESARIRYNWRLILTPARVLDYVAAHECAHLVEPNHSPRYWAVVKRLYGDCRAERAWLRTHGARVMATGAADPAT